MSSRESVAQNSYAVNGHMGHLPLADPGGAHPARAPPLTAADLWFFYAQNA